MEKYSCRLVDTPGQLPTSKTKGTTRDTFRAKFWSVRIEAIIGTHNDMLSTQGDLVTF